MDEITYGVLKNIVLGEDPPSPIVQILGLKLIEKKIDQSDRYRLLLSDGKYQHSCIIDQFQFMSLACMLGTQLNPVIQAQEAMATSIVRMDKYICNCIDKAACKYVIMILEMTVIQKQCPKLGQPIPLINALQNNDSSDSNVVKRPTTAPISSNPNKMPKSNVLLYSNRIDDDAKSKLLTLDCLNPYHNKWTIKVRVTSKTPIRKWSNTRGEGRLFSFNIIDTTCEMRVTAFNEECDKFYEYVVPDKVYLISRGKIKPANRQFSNLQNDYEMTLGYESAVELCDDTQSDDIPKTSFNFIQLKEILNKEVNELVDVIAVARSSSDLQNIVTKTTNKELAKRDVCLVDDTATISCTLWGSQAEQFDLIEPKIFALKGVRITDFSGRTLSVLNSTTITEKPDVPQSKYLQSWFEREGNQLSSLVDLSSGGQTFGSFSKNDINDYSTLKYLTDFDDALVNGGQADYRNVKCVIIGNKKENALYKSCPNSDCNKKLIETMDETFRCEKCNISTNEYKWRFILQINIADFSTSRWITCFNEVSEQVVGISAEELGNIKESGNNEYDEALLKINFTEYVMRLRTKLETYNDEQRIKLTCLSVAPINYASYGNELLNKLIEC